MVPVTTSRAGAEDVAPPPDAPTTPVTGTPATNTEATVTSPPPGAAAAVPTSEVVSMRTANAKTFATAEPGRYVSRIYAHPIHFKDAAGVWQDIDMTLVPLPDGRLRSRAHSSSVSVAPTAADAQLARVDFDADHSVAFRLQGSAPAPVQVSGTVATYAAALPEVAVEFRGYWAGLKEDLVLTSKSAPDTYLFPLTLRGVTAHRVDGEVVYKDAEGKEWGRTPRGFMQDSRRPLPADADSSEVRPPTHSEGVGYELVPHEGATALKVTLDRAWLDDPARVYPVRVDPTTTFGANTDDTYVQTNDTTRNDTFNDLNVGTTSAGANKMRSFIHFDTWFLRGRAKGIGYTRIATYLFDAWSCANRPNSMYRVTQGWWGGNMATYPGANVWEEVARREVSGCNAHWEQWDNAGILDMVHHWNVSRIWEDHGVMLMAFDENDNSQYRHYYSANQPGAGPHLVTDWWGEPNTPDWISPGDAVYENPPTLHARYLHSDEGTAGTLHFDLYNSGGGWLGGNPKGGLCHGCTATHVPSNLADGRYQWNVIGQDDAGRWGPRSGTTWFTLDRRPYIPDQLSPPYGTSGQSAPTLSARYNHPDPGNGSGQIVFKLYDGAGALISETYSPSICKGCTAGHTPSGLADGLYQWDVRGYDGGGTGNWRAFSDFSDRLTFRVDTTAPPPPVVSSSSHAEERTWSAQSAFQAGWTEPTDPTGISGYSVALDQVASTVPPETVTHTERVYSAALGDGKWFLHVRARDGVGNWGEPDHYEVWADAARPGAPTVTSPSHTDQTTWYTNPHPDFAWSGGDTISGLAGWSFKLDRAAGTIPDDTSEGTTATYSETDKSDGTHTFHVKRKNNAGTWGDTNHFNVNIDSTPPPAPTVTSSTHGNEATWYADANPSVSWSAADTAPVDGYSWVLDQASGTEPDTTSEGTATSQSWTGKADGLWWFHVKARNATGTWGATTHRAIRVDAVVETPTVTSSSHPTQTSWYALDDVVLSWSAPGQSGITGWSYTFDGTDPDTTSEGTATTRAYADMPDGTYTFKVRVLDGLGRWSAIASFAVRVDTSAPTISSTSSTTHPVEATWYANADPAVSWTSTDTAPVDGYSWVLDQVSTTTPNTTSEGTGTAASFIGKADGLWWFHVRARNATGTWGPAVHRAVRVDAVGPAAPVVTSSTHPTEASWYASNVPALAFPGSDDSGVDAYSYVLDQVATTTPDTTSEGAASTKGYTALADGVHWFHVRARNAAGVWSATTHRAVRVDTSAPTVGSVTSSTHPSEAVWYNNADPAVSWSGSDTAPVDGWSWTLDQIAGTTPDTTSEGTGTTASWTGKADGQWWFHVRARNATGTWGPTVHRAVRIDTTAPAAPTVSSPTHPNEGTWYTGTGPTFDFPASDHSGVDGYSYVLDQVATTTPDTTSEGTATTKAYTGLADGVHWFHVRARNPLGMWGATAHFSIRIDTTNGSPTVTSSTHPSQSTWYSSTAPTLNWSGTWPSGVTGWSYELTTTADTVPDTTSEGAGTSKGYTGLAGGTHWFHLRAQTGSGTWTQASHFKLQIDGTAPPAPTVSSSTHPTQTTWYANANPSVAYPTTDTAPVDGYSWVLDQAATTTPDTTAETTASTLNFTGLPDGVHWFHVRARNAAGLWGSTTHFKLQVDTSDAALAVSSSTHPSQTTWYASGAPALAFSAGPPSGVTGWSYELTTTADTVPDTMSEGTGTSTSYTGLADGVRWFHVRARTGAGTWTQASHFKLQIDGTPPAAPTVTSSTHPTETTWYADDDPSVSWSGSDSAPVDGWSWELNQTSTTDPDLVSDTTATTLNFSGMTNGQHWFHVRARNASGLWGPTRHFTVRVDTTAPALFTVSSTTHPSQTTWYSTDDPAFSFEATDVSGIAGYSYAFDQTATTDPDTTSEGTASTKSYTDVVNGSWWLHVRALNGAGLWSTTSHFKVQIDDTAPGAPTITSSTHPTQTAWHAQPNATLSFAKTDTAPVNGYSWQLDQNPAAIPDTTSEGASSTATVTPGEGTYYFHVRARNSSGLWSTTSHYTLKTDAVTGSPTISSSSHPDQNVWYSTSHAVLSWTASEESGVAGYSTSVTPDAAGNPGTVVTTATPSTEIDVAEDRLWHFNVRVKSNTGVWGPISSFRLKVDATPPERPTVSSTTHPSQGNWVNDNDPTFTFSTSSDVSGIAGYSHELTQDASTVPDDISEGIDTTKSFTDVAEGEWWFHVRARNGAGLWSETTHRRIKIDTTRPVLQWASATPEAVQPGDGVTFRVGWDTSTSPVRAQICLSENGESCTDTWLYGDYGAQSPSEVSHTTAADDLGQQTYLAYACDEANLCSSAQRGSFTVAAAPDTSQGEGQVSAAQASPIQLDSIIPYKWKVEPPQVWRFAEDFPQDDGRWTQRVREGAVEWNLYASRQQFVWDRSVETGDTPGNFWQWCDQVLGQEDPAPRILVTTRGLSAPSSIPGVEQYCLSVWGETRRIGSIVWINPRTSFWLNNDTSNMPNNVADLESVATHEFGHATGWRDTHLSGSDCPNNSGRNTMCASTIDGTAYGRSLESTDIRYRENAYTRGYWVAASDGGVFNFGGARFYGSLGGIRLARPIVGIAGRPQGDGYWMVGQDGGIFSFGGAPYKGSLPGSNIKAAPVVGMTPTPSGNGYWIASSDGGVFSFGDAPFHGSLGGIRLNQPIVGIEATRTGRGYWLLGRDGGIFAFGDAPFLGSRGGTGNEQFVGIEGEWHYEDSDLDTPIPSGYFLLTRTGRVYKFFDAQTREHTVTDIPGVDTRVTQFVGIDGTWPTRDHIPKQGYNAVAFENQGGRLYGRVRRIGDGGYWGQPVGQIGAPVIGVALKESGG